MPRMICLLRCVFHVRYVVANNQFVVRKKRIGAPFLLRSILRIQYSCPVCASRQSGFEPLAQFDDGVKLLKNHTKRKYHKRWSYTWFYYAILLYTIFNMKTRYIFEMNDKKLGCDETERTEIQHTKWQFTDPNGWERNRMRKKGMEEIVSGTMERCWNENGHSNTHTRMLSNNLYHLVWYSVSSL